MNKFRKLILYREYSYAEKDLSKPSIEDNKFVLSEKTTETAIKYLESGKILFEFISPTTDPYNELDVIPNKLLTDGTYVWDGIIMNWIQKYRVRLPISFLEHIEHTIKNQKFIADLDLILLIQKLNDGVEEIYIEK